MKPKNSVLVFAFCVFLATVALGFSDPQSASGSAQQPGGAYQNGFDHGRADAQRNLPSNNQPSDQWTTDEERSAYRQGYDAGYSAASSATAPSASPSTSGAGAPTTASGTAQPSASDAERFGYQDGLAAGRKDHDGGHSFRPTEGDMYKNADHGWTADFGDRDHYRQLYRQAYARGYQEGFGSTAPR